MKVKTKKTASKRFKITKSGKILRRHSRTSHLRSKQSSARKRRKSRSVSVSKASGIKVKRMVGK